MVPAHVHQSIYGCFISRTVLLGEVTPGRAARSLSINPISEPRSIFQLDHCDTRRRSSRIFLNGISVIHGSKSEDVKKSLRRPIFLWGGGSETYFFCRRGNTQKYRCIVSLTFDFAVFGCYPPMAVRIALLHVSKSARHARAVNQSMVRQTPRRRHIDKLYMTQGLRIGRMGGCARQ